MAKDKYEISLWEDIYVKANGTTGASAHYEEQKLCVIGSDTMTAQCRAIEPKLTRNVNGKNTFTFKMFYIYRDDKTGQMYDNPFLKLLVNERKVKVLWLNEWYDLVIKNIQEASNGKSIVFTCEDANINELAKSGFELTFDDELNTTEFTNQGTAEELVAATIDGTDWAIGNAETIPQYSEEPVFLVTIKDNESIPAVNQLTSESITLEQGDKILIYYNQLADLYNSVLDPDAGTVSSSTRYLQFAYTEDEFIQDQNNQLVINTDCYKTSEPVTVQVANSLSDSAINGKTIRIAFDTRTYDLYNLSKQYRAKRLVESTKTVIDQYTGKTCEVYKANSAGSGWSANDIIYKHVGTVFDEANTTINLAANPSAFTHVKGWDFVRLGGGAWHGATLEFYYDPVIDSINSYIKLNTYTTGSNFYLYNDCFKSSSQYFSGGVKVGEQYVFRVKIRNASDSETPGTYCTLSDFMQLSPVVVTSTVDTEINHKRPLRSSESGYASFFTPVTNQGQVESDGWISFILNCTKSFNAADIYSKNIGLFLLIQVAAVNKKFIEAFEFYKYVEGEDENGNIVRINPGDFDKNAIAQVKYQYYNFTKFDNDYKNGNAILDKINEYYLYSEVNDWDQVGSTISPVPVPGFAKIRSINIKQSNRFNILQTIAETFQCWIRFRVEHDSTGKIIYSKTNNVWRLQKYIDIVNEIGEDRGLGFIYGIDLQSISRTIESNSIVTKTIVLPNDNEFATEGQCRVSRSTQNPPRTDYVLNFDYYISHALLDKDQLFNDLYVNTISNEEAASLAVEGFYYWLNKWNIEYENISQEYKEKYMILLENQALYDTYKKVDEAAAQTILDAQASVRYYVSDQIVSEDWSAVLNWIITNNHQNDKPIKPQLEAIASQERLRATYGPILEKLQAKIDEYQADIDAITLRMQEIAKLIRSKTLAFYKKYAAFISEGSWTDQKYFDDNLYYLDATSVAYTSSRPKVSYNISVLRLTGLEQFKEKDFSLGEIAFVQDTEFFGYSDAARTTPYKEKVLISEITYNFDEPSKDSFKVQNYKTQFEDLFQRIAAATQSLQFNEGIYARAGEVVSSDGTLNMSFLENTFDENGNVLNRTSVNQSVITDATGVTVKSLVDPANVVRITSGGIFITNDGGETWKNAIRGDGISTKYLTAGQIDVGIIQVMDGEHPSFKWDSNGINAYWHDNNIGFNYTTFVRMDQYGFYGVAAADSSWVPTNEASIRNLPGAFGATWSGFFANNASGDHVFATDASGNLSITGTITANAGDIGGWAIGSTALYKKRFASYTSTAGVTYDDGYYYIYASAPTNPSATSRAFGVLYRNANDQTVEYLCEMTYGGKLFARNAEITGTVYASDGWFAGTLSAATGSFSGMITANEGTIGGWTIDATHIKKTDSTGKIRAELFAPETIDVSTNRAFCIVNTNYSTTSSLLRYPFCVYYDGTMIASKGQLGRWEIGPRFLETYTSVDSVSGASYRFYLQGSKDDNGAAAPTSGNSLMAVKKIVNGVDEGAIFQVTWAGKVTCKDLKIEGGSINIGSGVFSVSSAGKVTCNNIVATGGTIGGCAINSNGNLEVPAANITGKLTANHIDATDLTVNAANISGTLSASHIDTALLRTDNLQSAIAQLSAVQLNTLEIDGSTHGIRLSHGAKFQDKAPNWTWNSDMSKYVLTAS